MSKSPAPADDQRGTASNIAGTICRELRGRILAGKLAPGERLPGERELAQRYDTNRNTLREAVRMLEQARLVSVRHGQGVTVSDFRRTGTLELLPAFLENASNVEEVVRVLGDILPARLMVLEFAARIAARRADAEDLQRLRQITGVLINAFEQGNPVVVAHDFRRWLDALVDAGHSVAVRWIANPFLEAYRELMDRFPALWVLEPTFPQHLTELIAALEAHEEERAIEVLRVYYQRVDSDLMQLISGGLRPG
jgi:DNA-binding FadR family transcriptional regulator